MKTAPRTILIDEPDDSIFEEEFGYEPFEAEKNYISPDQVGEEIIARIERLPSRLAAIEATY